MRDRDEGNLLGKQIRLYRIIHINATCLVEQLIHAGLARAGYGLVGRNDNSLDFGQIMKRL